MRCGSTASAEQMRIGIETTAKNVGGTLTSAGQELGKEKKRLGRAWEAERKGGPDSMYGGGAGY